MPCQFKSVNKRNALKERKSFLYSCLKSFYKNIKLLYDHYATDCTGLPKLCRFSCDSDCKPLISIF